MMKLLKIALLLISVPLLALGGEGLYHVVRNRQQVAQSCAQTIEQPPRALWLRVTGCDFDYVGAGYRESKGRIAEMFFPVRPPGQPKMTPAVLVAATRDPEVLAIAQNTIGSGRQPDQEAFLVMMLRIVTTLKAAREVEGYARSGVIDLALTRGALRGLNVPLASRYVVLDLHARPSFLVPGMEAGAGVVLLLLSIVLRTRRSPADVEERVFVEQLAPSPELPAEPATDLPERPTVGAQAEPTPYLPAEPPIERPVEPASRRLPAVMLLNLDPAAGPAAIEGAPPLGSRDDVIRRIAGALGPFQVDGSGRGSFRGPEWSLALNLGKEEPVWTATIEARGEGSVRALETLAHATGWRIFIPKRGTFVDPAQLEQVERP